VVAVEAEPVVSYAGKEEEIISILAVEIADIRASDDRADRKAQILFGFTGATLALTISATGRWIDESPSDGMTAILAYGAVASFGSAALLLALAVRPQLQASAARASWIRLVLGRSSGDEVLNRVLSETSREKVDRLAHLIYELARRARRKHQRIQWALLALFVGAALVGAASIIHK